MARRHENSSFVCLHCSASVPPCTNGGYRNHCPRCLWSCHVDGQLPGDRGSDCGGAMQPLGLTQRHGKGLAVVHRCVVCGTQRRNRIATGTEMPDDIDAVAALPPLWAGPSSRTQR